MFIYIIGFLYNIVAMQELKDRQDNIIDAPLTLVQSYLAWWEAAGLNNGVSEKNLNWLEQKEDLKQPKLANTIEKPNQFTNKQVENRQAENKQSDEHQHDIISDKNNTPNINNRPDIKVSVPLLSADQWPKTLDDFHKAMASGMPLAGNIYSKKPILPRLLNVLDAQNMHKDNAANISDQKTIMLISDFPDDDDVKNDMLLSGKQNNLIVNMMTACNFQNHNIYIASLASTKPIYDILPDDDLPQISALMYHHVALVNPDAIISLGSTACNALLGAELMKMRESLHYFNHNVQNKKMITTFHPRSLLAKPQYKPKAWKDLQILIKKGFL